MTRPPVVVAPETPLRDVAALLGARHISGVPVVSGDEVVGVVSESDIVEKERGFERPHRSVADRVRHRPAPDPVVAITAADAMTSPAVVVDTWISDHGAAWLMREHDVNRLPVVHRGELLGVIARGDLVRHFARSDDDIARDIREQVMQPLEAEDVDVTVVRGRVVLAGPVRLERDLEDVPHAVSMVPGVVSVEARLSTPSREPV